MKTIDLSTILAVVAAVGTLGAIFAWWLSRFLEDRLDSKEGKMEIGFLKERFVRMEKDNEARFARLEKDVENLQDNWNRVGRNT